MAATEAHRGAGEGSLGAARVETPVDELPGMQPDPVLSPEAPPLEPAFRAPEVFQLRPGRVARYRRRSA